MGWVAEENFGGEAADCDVSADGVKEGRVGRRAEGAGNVGGEGSVFEVRDRGSSGVGGEGGDEWGDSRWEWWGLRGYTRWDVESPHVIAGLFRANENGCRVSGSKNGE